MLELDPQHGLDPEYEAARAGYHLEFDGSRRGIASHGYINMGNDEIFASRHCMKSAKPTSDSSEVVATSTDRHHCLDVRRQATSVFFSRHATKWVTALELSSGESLKR